MTSSIVVDNISKTFIKGTTEITFLMINSGLSVVARSVDAKGAITLKYKQNKGFFPPGS